MPYKSPEKARARARRHYAANREAKLAYQRAYSARNSATIKAQKNARYHTVGRARRGLPGPTHTLSAWCECCGREPSKHALALDHDHTTGAFRGWLCMLCNTAIGKLGDNIAGVEKALRYLQRAANMQPPNFTPQTEEHYHG